ncbi:hypothetical protein ACRAWD_30330 [Caulobacter segnis]
MSVAASVYIFVGAAQLFYTLAPEVRQVWGIDPSDPEVIEQHAEALSAIRFLDPRLSLCICIT